MSDLNLVLIQSNLLWQDPTSNCDHFEKCIAGLDNQPDLVALPEMFNTGFSMSPHDFAESMSGPTVSWMKTVAEKYQTCLCGSLIVKEGSQYFNRLVWASPDGGTAVYDKRHLFRMAGEDKRYSSGSHRIITTIGDWRICPLVCYDLRFPVWSRNRNDYDLLLYVANWPAARSLAWQSLLPARAIENLCYVAGLNRVGTDANEIEYAGDSYIGDFFGQPLSTAGDKPACLTATLNLDKLKRFRDKFPAHLDADDFSISR